MILLFFSSLFVFVGDFAWPVLGFFLVEVFVSFLVYNHLDEEESWLLNSCRPKAIPALVKWTSLFPFKGLLCCKFLLYSNFNRTFCKQTVETLIRRRILIWVYTVCLFPTKRALWLYVLTVTVFLLLCMCLCILMSLLRGAMGWSVFCNCDISWSFPELERTIPIDVTLFSLKLKVIRHTVY